jgi:hypothetical protein
MRRHLIAGIALSAVLFSACSNDTDTATDTSTTSTTSSTIDVVSDYRESTPTTAVLSPEQDAFCKVANDRLFELRASNETDESTPPFIAALRELDAAAPADMKGPYRRFADALEAFTLDPSKNPVGAEREQLQQDNATIGQSLIDVCGLYIVKLPPPGVVPGQTPGLIPSEPAP